MSQSRARGRGCLGMRMRKSEVVDSSETTVKYGRRELVIMLVKLTAHLK